MWICIAAALIIEGSWVFLCVVMKLKDVLLKSIYLICWECVAELVPDLFGSYAVFFLDICQSWILIFWSVCAACSSVWSENTEDTYRHKWYSLFFFTERFHRGKEHENDSVQLRQQSFLYWSGLIGSCDEELMIRLSFSLPTRTALSPLDEGRTGWKETESWKLAVEVWCDEFVCLCVGLMRSYRWFIDFSVGGSVRLFIVWKVDEASWMCVCFCVFCVFVSSSWTFTRASSSRFTFRIHTPASRPRLLAGESRLVSRSSSSHPVVLQRETKTDNRV